MLSIVDEIANGDIVDKAVEVGSTTETVSQTEFCETCNTYHDNSWWYLYQ
jgi:hypothetical protein